MPEDGFAPPNHAAYIDETNTTLLWFMAVSMSTFYECSNVLTQII